MKYRSLIAKHPDYQDEYWAECRALYRGGESLLRDRATMARLFPRNPNEEPDIYEQRVKRAEYMNYVGAIVDFIVASLCSDTLTMTSEPQADPFFETFAGSMDGRGLTLLDLLRDQILTALQTRVAWTLVDLPPRDDGAVIETEVEEEEIDQLRALAFPVEPESVFDWDCDASGSLSWALLCMRRAARPSLDADRNTIVESFTHYTRDTWERFEVTYRRGQPPKPNQDIARVDGGSHSFDGVPLVRLELPHGLWALDRVHNLSRSHLNKRSAVTWSEFRHLFPILASFLGTEVATGSGEIPSEVQQNPNRADDQVYGIGRIAKFGRGDELKYVAPPADIYNTALKDLDGLRDEIHRVLHQMALATDNGAAALKRSGDSKKQDKAAAVVVLAHLGGLLRKHGVDVFTLASKGRRDPPTKWAAHGMRAFDLADVSSVIEDALTTDQLKIPSETFQRIRIFGVARRILGATATPEQLESIRTELERNVSAEEFAGNAAPSAAREYGEGETDQATDPDGGTEPDPNNAQEKPKKD